jgi:hypothetical protein
MSDKKIPLTEEQIDRIKTEAADDAVFKMRVLTSLEELKGMPTRVKTIEDRCGFCQWTIKSVVAAAVAIGIFCVQSMLGKK